MTVQKLPSIHNPETGRILKNPEKFIAKLQQKIKFFINQKEFWRKQYNESGGELIVTWKAHNKHIGTGDSHDLFNFNVGDIVAHIGKVTSVKASKCSAGNKESSIEYTVVQTRRMPKNYI